MKKTIYLIFINCIFLMYAVDSSGQCACSGNCTNPPTDINNSSTNELYCASVFLCAEGIIDGGTINPSSNIIREDVAKIIFLGLYDGNQNANPITDNYPVPFADLQGNPLPYYKYAKAMSYLEYDENISVFDRKFFNFNPGRVILREDLAKAYVEAFNIPISTNNTPYYQDPNYDIDDPLFKYVQTFAEQDIANTGGANANFNPKNPTTRGEAFLFLYRILCTNDGRADNITVTAPNDDDYFEPGNYTPFNFSNKPSLSDANFDAYSKTSFYIPGRNIPLVFAHNYSSHLTELPEQLFPVCPLGRGWSHSYNSYVVKVPGYNSPNSNIPAQEDQYVIFWPGGSMHVYQDMGGSFEVSTKGIYDDFQMIGTNQIKVTKKNQMVYTFEITSTNTPDPVFMLRSVRDRNNNTIILTYQSGTNNLAFVTGTAGRKLTFNYNVEGYLETVTDPIGRVINFDYDFTFFDLRFYTDAESKTTEYGYPTVQDPTASGVAHLLTLIKLPNGNTIDNQYEDRKLNSTKTNNSTTGQSINTAIDWKTVGNYDGGTESTLMIDDGSSSREYKYENNALGNLSALDTPTNNIDDVQYTDPSNPTLPSQVMVDAIPTYYLYDTDGNVREIQQPESVTHKFTYTSKNDIDVYTNPRGNDTDFNYDGNGNLKQIVTPIGTTNMNYNSFGQPASITNPEGIAVTLGYNSFGNQNMVTAPSGLVSGATYDGASRLKESTNPNGQVTKYDYDQRDFITQTTDALSHVTQFRYDDNGNLIEIENAKNEITSLDYDKNDWLTTESFGGFSKNYVYDDEGKLVRMTKPDGTDLFYTYDEDTGNLEDDDYAQYTYDDRNRLETVTRGLSVITYEYDDLNRILSIDHSGDKVSYGYDPNSNITTLTYPGNKIVNYTYDAKDRLETVTDWNNNKTVYTYLDDDRLNTVTYPNGIAAGYEYDNAGRMTKLINYKNGVAWIRYVFDLDDLGNHLQENKIDQPFGYPDAPTENLTYSYNNINRIETMTGDMGTNLSWSFDDNGNTLSKTGTTYSWDVHDMLLTYNNGTDSHSYEYDGLGNRRKATRNGVVTNYTLDILGMSRVLIENDGGGNPENYFVYGLGLISRVKTNGDTNYYSYDFRGSTIAMTNESGSITHSYNYDAWGKIMDKVETDKNCFRFVGNFGVMYETQDLTFMRARYYDSEVGRFLSEDPIWSTNLYPYSGNNPIMYADADGKIGILAASAIGGVISGAFEAVSEINESGWNALSVGKAFTQGFIKGSVGTGIAIYATGALAVAGATAVVAGSIGGAAGGLIGQAAEDVFMFQGREWSDSGTYLTEGVLGGVLGAASLGLDSVGDDIARLTYKGGPLKWIDGRTIAGKNLKDVSRTLVSAVGAEGAGIGMKFIENEIVKIVTSSSPVLECVAPPMTEREKIIANLRLYRLSKQ